MDAFNPPITAGQQQKWIVNNWEKGNRRSGKDKINKTAFCFIFGGKK